MFQPLFRDLRQTSTERFVKPAVVRDCFGAKKHYQNLRGSARSHQGPMLSTVLNSTEHGFMLKPCFHLTVEVIKHLERELLLSVEHELLTS